jgi:Fic family protein
MKGLIDANARMRDDGIDAVLQAASTAFGFVYVHPLQDGNGRLHRCLIHHVLAERKFTPPGMVFPVSSVMLDRIDDYRTTLQSHSGPLMEFIDWRPTPDRNVEVLNDTADLYRYFDCTDEAEFLYGCVKRTVEYDLPHEIDYLRRHDEARRKIMDTVEMPDRLADELLLFIRQNDGTLSKKRREQEFGALADDEVARIEEVVRVAFDGFKDGLHE